jgi:hypothetical protein
MLLHGSQLHHQAPLSAVRTAAPGVRSFRSFQAEMQLLLDEMIRRGPPAADDCSIAAQLYRVRGTAGLDDARLLSEIGILFVEGFETTGHTISWTLFNVATVPGGCWWPAGLGAALPIVQPACLCMGRDSSACCCWDAATAWALMLLLVMLLLVMLLLVHSCSCMGTGTAFDWTRTYSWHSGFSDVP